MRPIQILTVAAVAVFSSWGTYKVMNVGNRAMVMNGLEPASKQTVLERIIEEGKLRCGYMSYAPYIEIDTVTGEATGVAVDMTEAIAKKIGVDVEWSQETGFGTFIEDIKANRFDAVCAPIWKNASRATQVSFSIPYGYQTVEAWVRIDDDRFSSLTDINKETVTISVTDGEMGETIANQSFPKAKQFSIPQSSPFSDLLMNVVTGKADVVFVEPKFVEDFLKNNPEILKKVALEKPLRAFPITMVVSKEAQDLKRVIDSALEEMMNTAEMDEILIEHNRPDLFLKPTRSF